MLTPDISIVIPSYNRSSMLLQTLHCLAHQDTGAAFTYEIVVLDDMSDDDTPEVVRKFAALSTVLVRYVLGEGMGYTHALNSGVEASRGRYIAFFDDDQLTHEHWLSALYRVAVDKGADLVGGPIALRIAPEVHDKMGPVYRDMCGETHDIIFPDKYIDTDPLPAGGNRLVKREVFEQVGAFDENMLTGGCDRDFLLRALFAGFSPGWAKGGDIEHVIAVDRITPERMKWYSLQWGCSFAYIDWKRWGKIKTTMAAVARIGQALLVHFPLSLCYQVLGNEIQLCDRRALLWRAVGYVRKTLGLLFPIILSQRKFFSTVEFRRGRADEAP
ncbi:MAG: glycosyltransferase family 2 protein [Desulfobulbaceae bacterium]|nr:glycosyltransferase family 2 protein [Desulfobulbaceae bacterium]